MILPTSISPVNLLIILLNSLLFVKTEFSKFGGLLEKVQKNLQSAGDQLEEVMGKRTRAIERKLRQVEQLPHEESQKILPIDVEDDLTDY